MEQNPHHPDLTGLKDTDMSTAPSAEVAGQFSALINAVASTRLANGQSSLTDAAFIIVGSLINAVSNIPSPIFLAMEEDLARKCDCSDPRCPTQRAVVLSLLKDARAKGVEFITRSEAREPSLAEKIAAVMRQATKPTTETH